MENKINVAEILKNCPSGMELYSPLCGKCVFDRLNNGTIICKKQNTQEIAFTREGYYMIPVFDNCECMIFPSKDQRDWSKFQMPFNDGDVVVDNSGAIFLYRQIHTYYEEPYADFYCGLTSTFRSFIIKTAEAQRCGKMSSIRHATEEEKEELFKAIKDNGYKWNEKTKTLEKLIEPKFRIGDRIQNKKSGKRHTITKIYQNCYECDNRYIVTFENQDNYELTLDKFDITTLIPFESRVLVRDYSYGVWKVSFWGCLINSEHGFIYDATRGCYKQCIPYEGNEHLLGTKDNCDEFFKTWR